MLLSTKTLFKLQQYVGKSFSWDKVLGRRPQGAKEQKLIASPSSAAMTAEKKNNITEPKQIAPTSFTLEEQVQIQEIVKQVQPHLTTTNKKKEPKSQVKSLTPRSTKSNRPRG
ncbi:hypothetical protein [Candidatus Tisiphia endosymbiont of Beris chalybata]|uniref:hypothetical protein n=1 Tax=Candidatus Tisiphia endosymbiont of Beris chalybata TaxID=3066262 RepID=UPI00312C8C2A